MEYELTQTPFNYLNHNEMYYIELNLINITYI